MLGASMPTRASPTTHPAIPVLWDELAAFPASRIDDALARLMAWFQEHLDVDDVLWLGCVRMLDTKAATHDPLLGWRLRARQSLLPKSEAVRQLRASYLDKEHYGRLTPAYFAGTPRPDADVHVGEATRTLVQQAGQFRAHRLRDGFVDYAEFRQTEHYRLYYTEPGISDRIWVLSPVDEHTESTFVLDRHRRAGQVRRQPFTDRDSALAAAVLQGQRAFHRQMILSHGARRGVKVLSPLKRRVLLCLLTGQSDKEIAEAVALRPLSLRKYITELYGEYGVKTRAGLMALWLGEIEAGTSA